MTTEKRLRDFKKIVLNAIDECWNKDIYAKNCPPIQYDYEANGEIEPQSIDIDSEYYDDGTVRMKMREYMVRMATEAFRPGLERYYRYEHEEDDDEIEDDGDDGS